MSRWIVVDNTDSNLQYTGAWSSISGSAYEKQGNFGKPYRGTLHSTTAGQASVSYTFQGSQGRIFGTTNVKTTNGVKDPTWECKVDDTVITLETPFAYVENNWVLCSWDANTVPPGTHTVTVTAKSNGQAFLFDNFRYVPSSEANIQNVDISVSYTDSQIQYGSGWGNLGTIAKMAPDGGSVLTFPFYGTGITWMGTIPKELPHGSATADYAIDSQSTTTFTLAGGSASTTIYFQEVFQVVGLSLGHHTLVVTSRGQTSLTPLVLNNFIIQGGSSPEPANSNPGTSTGGAGDSGNSSGSDGISSGGGNQSSGNTGNTGNTGNSAGDSTTTSSGGKQISSSTGSPISSGVSATGSRSAASSSTTNEALDGTAVGTSASGSGNLNDNNGNKTSLGSIIGGAVGGILLILLILAFVVYCRRRKRNRMRHSYPQDSTSEFGYTEQVQPFFTDAAPITSRNHSGATAQGLFNQQMEHTGSSSSSKPTQMISTSNSSATSPPTSPTPFLTWNGQNQPPNSRDSGMGSYSGSSDQLRGPSTANRSSKSREAARESTQTGASAPIIVNHEDSGYRIPQPESIPSPSPEAIIEYPPRYTPS